MTRVVLAIMIGALVTGAAQQPVTTPQQRPTFRAGVDIVAIDVSVRNGGRPVDGLTAKDFTLADNGVAQEIDLVDAASVPVDLTLVLDTSGNPFGTLDDKPNVAKVTDRVRAEVARISGMLRAEDRMRVLTVDTYVREVIPFGSPTSATAIETVETDGKPSLADALVVALAHTVEPNRRHVVLARTKGRDVLSATNLSSVADLARRSDVMLHVVTMESEFDEEAQRRGWQCNTDHLGICQPVRRFWSPGLTQLFGGGLAHPLTPTGRALADASDATGGGLYQTSFLSTPSIEGTFQKAIDDFRHSYVLRYRPRGVSPSGWHDVKVTVPSFPDYSVRWRRGYGVDEPESPVPAPVAALPAALADLVRLTDARQYDAVTIRLRDTSDKVKLLRDFTAGGNPWPSAPRREAVFALELAIAAAFSQRDDALSESKALLERFHRLIRNPLEADDFERDWLETEIAIALGTIKPAFAEPLIKHALARFPAHPRFLLARAIAADQRWPLGLTTGSPLLAAEKPTAAEIQDVITRYETAGAHAETAVEASVRLARFLHRLGRDPEAIARINRATGVETEPTVAYLRDLVRGQILQTLQRNDDAVSAFRAAAALMPGAQSADVGLMNALTIAGGRREAESIAERLQARSTPVFDPWAMYWQGDLRRLPTLMTHLREVSR